MYKDGASVKYFSSAKIKIIIQSMIYMISVFIMFLVSLNIYFKSHILTKKDSILYSLFIFVILYVSSFILIKIGINVIDDVINNFNNVVLTYNTNTFENIPMHEYSHQDYNRHDLYCCNDWPHQSVLGRMHVQ